MSKQYRKEALGRVDGSISAKGIFTTPHSPEDESNLRRLIEALQPYFMQGIKQTVNLAVDEYWQTFEGDFIQYIIQYINNYFTNITTGQMLRAGNGIQISSETVSVRDGKGLEADDGDLNVELATTPGLEFDVDTAAGKLQVKDGDGITIDANGVKVEDDGTNQFDTTHRAAGCGLSFTASDGSGKLRVKPLDFLYTSADD